MLGRKSWLIHQQLWQLLGPSLGHVVDRCYKLHGYPPRYKFKNKGGQPPFANNVIAIKDHASEPVTLTKAQYQQLVGLLNS